MTRLDITEKFSLPLDWLLATTVVFGTRGSGKTTFGSVVAEQLDKAKQRFCAIDLKGDYWGLKSTADGKGDGIPVVIFGGDHADLPLEEGAGDFVGQTVAGLQQSVIIDLEHFSKGKQVRFLAAFFAALYDANRDPMLLIADEAQRYAPQKSFSPEAQICLGAVEDIVKLGRKHGIGVLVITQRGSSLNKEVSELCDMMVAFRAPGVRDQERINDWLEANATEEQRDQVMDRGVLSGLDTGRAAFVTNHPDLRGGREPLLRFEQVRMRWTFDSCATPRIGQRRKEPKRLAKPDLDVIRAKMSEAIERAKENDPKALRVKIVECQQQIEGLKLDMEARAEDIAQQLSQTVVHTQVVEKLVVTDSQIESVGDLLGGLNKWVEHANTLLLSATGEIGDAAEGLARALASVRAQPRLPEPEYPPMPTPTQLRTVSPTGKSWIEQTSERMIRNTEAGKHLEAGGVKMNGGMRRLLIAIVEHGPCTKEQLSVLTGYKRSSRGSHTSRLNVAGLIIRDEDGSWIATDSGRIAVAGETAKLPTGRALRDYWQNRLSGGEAKVFELAVRAYPHGITRDAITEATGYQRSSRDSFISRLTARKLLNRQGKQVVASRHLFEVAP